MANSKSYGPIYRYPGSYDPDLASLTSGLKCEDVSRTNQDSRDESDINTIVRRFGLTGEIPVSLRTPLPEAFFDCDLDYRECLDTIRAAAVSFDSLPADVRARFANDPSELVAYAADPKNLEQLRVWGLAPPAPPAPPA